MKINLGKVEFSFLLPLQHQMRMSIIYWPPKGQKYPSKVLICVE